MGENYSGKYNAGNLPLTAVLLIATPSTTAPGFGWGFSLEVTFFPATNEVDRIQYRCDYPCGYSPLSRYNLTTRPMFFTRSGGNRPASMNASSGFRNNASEALKIRSSRGGFSNSLSIRDQYAGEMPIRLAKSFKTIPDCSRLLRMN